MHLTRNNKELERKWQYQVGVLFTDQNTEETYTFSWKIFLESKYSNFFPLNSQISCISLTELVSQMCWAPIRMNVKGLQNGCPVLCENLNPESKCMPSPIQNFSGAHACTHPDPIPTASAESQQTWLPPATCKDPFMKLCLCRLMIEKDTESLLLDPCYQIVRSELWR